MGGEAVVTKINIIIISQSRNLAVLNINIIFEIILLVLVRFSSGGLV